MSRVYLIAADKPLPLCDRQEIRTSTTNSCTVSFARGFCVAEHRYYRAAVDMLGYISKPFLYELEAEVCEYDLACLRAYLAQNFHSGETVELWSIWVGDVTQPQPAHDSGTLAEFDMETLAQLCNPPAAGDAPGQCRLTVRI